MSEPLELDEYLALKRQLESLRTKRDQAQGRLQQVKKSLQKDFNVTSLAEARKQLAALDKQLDKDAKQLQGIVDDLVERFAEEA